MFFNIFFVIAPLLEIAGRGGSSIHPPGPQGRYHNFRILVELWLTQPSNPRIKDNLPRISAQSIQMIIRNRLTNKQTERQRDIPVLYIWTSSFADSLQRLRLYQRLEGLNPSKLTDWHLINLLTNLMSKIIFPNFRKNWMPDKEFIC